MFYGFCFCNTVYIKKTLLTKDFVYFIYFYQPQNMLAIFFSASEYAYNMLRFFRNFSLNMLIVVMLIKKKVYVGSKDLTELLEILQNECETAVNWFKQIT